MPVAAVATSVVVGGCLVRVSPVVAAALIVGPVLAWLLTRPTGGLVIGVCLILTLPYWQTFGSSQITVARLASLAAAASLLASRQKLRPRPTDFALALLTAVLILGWLLQYDQPHAGRVISQELTPLGFYLGARAIPRERIGDVMIAVLFAGALGALTVLFEFARGHVIFADPTKYDWNASIQSIFRPGGIFGSPPAAGTVLAWAIVLGIGSLSYVRSRVRSAAIVCLFIMGLALVLTFTRAAFIGLAVGVLIFLWLIRSPLLRPSRVAWGLGVIALIIFFVLPAVEQSSLFQQALVRPGNLGYRVSFWSLALPVATASPHNLLFGLGSGSLEAPVVAATAVVPAKLASAMVIVNSSVHNEFVSILIEQGLIGIGSLVLFLVIPFATAARAARRTGSHICAALAAGLVVITVVMVADTVLLNNPSFAALLMTAGLVSVAAVDLRAPSTHEVRYASS